MKARLLVSLAAAVVVLGGLAIAPASADKSIGQKVEAAGEALDDANAKVRRALDRIEKTKSKIPGVEAELRDAEKRAAELLGEKEAAEAELAIVEDKQDALQVKIDVVQGDMDVIQGTVDDIARAIYQQGPLSEVDAVLNASNPTDLTRRLATIDSISKAQNKSLFDLRTARSELAVDEVRMMGLVDRADDARAKVASKYRDAKAEENKAQKARDKLARLKAKQTAALRTAKAHQDKVKQRYDQLKDQQAAIKAAAAGAAGQYAAQLGGSPVGSLTWPIPGGTTSGQVGPRIHPVYGYRSCHTGIDISGGMGTPIRSAADGIVVSITNGGPYGLATLIAHSGGLSTFYAHQSRTAAGTGDRVKAGEVIGYVGSTGYSTGPHLHFETRIGGVPYNPMGWFGGSKFRISC